MVVIKGHDRERMIEVIETIADEIRKQDNHFDRLFYRVDLSGIKDRALLYLPSQQIKRVQDQLHTMSLLLDPPVLAGLDPLFTWKSLTLVQLAHAAVTTAAAFFVAMFAQFSAVAERGWIAGSGLLLCAVSCFTVLPALLLLFDRTRTQSRNAFKETHAERRRWLPGLFHKPRMVLAVGAAATIFFALWALNITYRHNLLELQARTLESVQSSAPSTIRYGDAVL